MNRDGGKDLELDASVENLPAVAERSQEDDKKTRSLEDGCYPSASEDKQEVLGRPVSSSIHPAKKRCPKTIKHWLSPCLFLWLPFLMDLFSRFKSYFTGSFFHGGFTYTVYLANRCDRIYKEIL